MTIRIRVENRNPQLDVTLSQRWTRNARTWGVVAIASLVAIGSLAGLVMALNKHIALALDLANNGRALKISLGCGAALAVSGAILPLAFINSKAKQNRYDLLSKDFEGSKDDLLEAAKTLSSCIIKSGRTQHFYNAKNLINPVPREDKDNWASQQSGWSQYHLSPNEREMGYRLMEKINSIWTPQHGGSWVER